MFDDITEKHREIEKIVLKMHIRATCIQNLFAL